MKNCKKNCESMGAVKLALIITGSIVAAAGVILLLIKLCKKKCHTKKVCDSCHEDLGPSDSWDIDEDVLGDLELDDDCDCCCDCEGEDSEDDVEKASEEAKSEETSEEKAEE